MEYTQPVMTMPVTTTGSDGTFGGGNWMNNPFAYLIWIYALRWMNPNGNGIGGGEIANAAMTGQALNSAQVDAIRETVGEIKAAVECGNANGMRFLDQICNEVRGLGVGLTGISSDLCSVKTAVLSQLSNMQWQISQDTASVVSAIKDCCCATGSKIDALGCGIEKEILAQTTTLSNAISAAQFANQAGFNSITNGISSLGFQIAQQDCGLKQLISAEGCQTRQLMRDLHTEDLINQKNTQIETLQGQLFKYSQAAQTAEIIAALKPTTTTTPTT